MNVNIEVVTDSVSSGKVRLTTFTLTYPRCVHSEFMTHRVFSRNASSSRAIPVKKQIQEVIDNPYIPKIFYKNQKGMQGGEPIEDQQMANVLWLLARDEVVKVAKSLVNLDIHKQHINRILEPWAYITVVVTATDFYNFFGLRYHEQADPTIIQLAKPMWEAFVKSTPKELQDGEWHLPFITEDDWDDAYNQDCNLGYDTVQKMLLKRSVARCARVSYKNHDGTSSTWEQDFQLYDRLLGSEPIHASPAEHQAMAVGDPNVHSGNLRGWIQHRKTLRNENITKFVAPELDWTNTI